MVKVTVVVKVQKLVDLENVVVMMINVNQMNVIMLEILMEVPVAKVILVISVYLMINVKVVFVINVDIPIKVWEDDPNKWRWDNDDGKKNVKMDEEIYPNQRIKSWSMGG